MFSLPIYPDLEPKYIREEFIPFLKKHKSLIYDLYFTVRIPPFEQDAMGSIFSDEDIPSLISNALIIQNETKIPISAVFNNIFISPSEKNLDIFIKHFTPLYNLGVKSITIPFTSWLMFGKLQKSFPDLYIKNTVLQSVSEPREIYNLAINGFDYINLDRNLLRNQNKLKIIDKARKAAELKLGKTIKLSILFNENCIGNCPIQNEHYLYNVHNDIKTQPNIFFKSSMGKISCLEWEKKSPELLLKKASVINDEKFMNGLEMIDAFKLHGRESKNVFLNSLNIIKSTYDKTEIIDELYYTRIKYNIKDIEYHTWIEKVKNCNFDCWDCTYCDDLFKK